MKNWKKFTAATLAALALAGMLAGCGNDADKKVDNKQATKIVTDLQGREVSVPQNVKHLAVVPIPWASVIYAIDGSSERLAAIHPGAMSAYTGKFLETKDKHFAQVDTKIVAQNFSVNIESAAQAGVDTAVLWQYQEKDAEKLSKVGIPTVLIYNDTVDNLKKSFLIIGKLLGKEERAEQINKAFDMTTEKIMAKKAWEQADKPKVLFLRNSKLRLQGNDNFIHEAIRIGGGQNPYDQIALNASSEQTIPMEEVYKLNPDIILLSNFDKFVPDDLYNNKIAGQDWSTVKAVQEKRVYKVPMGIYRWDAPGVETPLMMEWLAHVLQPELFKELDVRADAKKFYEDYMHYKISEADMAQIFADEANKNSKPLF